MICWSGPKFLSPSPPTKRGVKDHIPANIVVIFPNQYTSKTYKITKPTIH